MGETIIIMSINKGLGKNLVAFTESKRLLDGTVSKENRTPPFILLIYSSPKKNDLNSCL